MSLLISSVFTYDEDAGNYIQAVETADAQALEPATRQAINNFVLGCKADGIWTAIKASCILAGARTLAGALVPLLPTMPAPTPVGFIGIGTDYVRKTGLVGNGSTKYLNSNRSTSIANDPQDSRHCSVYISASTGNGCHLGSVDSDGNSLLLSFGGDFYARVSSASGGLGLRTGLGNAVGFAGASRAAPATFINRISGANETITSSSALQSPPSNILVFARGGPSFHTASRLAFYSIGESLDLALLDTRVTALINAFGASIP